MEICPIEDEIKSDMEPGDSLTKIEKLMSNEFLRFGITTQLTPARHSPNPRVNLKKDLNSFHLTIFYERDCFQYIAGAAAPHELEIYRRILFGVDAPSGILSG